jgi:hypothetical protein
VGEWRLLGHGRRVGVVMRSQAYDTRQAPLTHVVSEGCLSPSVPVRFSPRITWCHKRGGTAPQTHTRVGATLSDAARAGPIASSRVAVMHGRTYD